MMQAIAIWRYGEDKKDNNSSEDARSLQQPLGRRVVGTTGVGGLVEKDFWRRKVEVNSTSPSLR